MKNFFNILNSDRPTAEEVLAISSNNPSQGINLAEDGMVFSEFNDWLRIATKGFVASPYAHSWRKLALHYPVHKAVKDLDLFFGIIGKKLILADQAKAILFSIPAKKLPKVKILQKLSAEDDEQARIKNLLIRKKILGDEKFIKEFLSEIVKAQPDGKIYFPIESGRIVTCDSNVLTTSLEKKRIKTLFGMATLIAVRERQFNEAGTVHYFFFLVDGDEKVCKMKEEDFRKTIILTPHLVEKAGIK
jgi:hypothetical protein